MFAIPFKRRLGHSLRGNVKKTNSMFKDIVRTGGGEVVELSLKTLS